MAKITTNTPDGNIAITPNGTGKTVVGTGAASATLQSSGNYDLVLQTGNATTGSITITDGANGNIAITPNGTGEVDISKVDIDGGTIDGVTIGGSSAGAGTFTTATATTGNITTVNATTVDSTNLQVTNIKAKDGTAAGSIADSTGVVTLASSVLTTADINGGTIDGTTIATSDITVGAGKTLNVSAGTLATSAAQKQAIVDGATISGDSIDGGTISNFASTGIDDNATSGPALTIDASGNVGIGTNSPTAKLESSANIGFGTGGTFGAGQLYSDSNWGVILRAKQASPAQAEFAFQNAGGTERLRIDSSGNLKFDSGYGSVATAYGCRAWVNFNGTGTVAIRGNGNASSIADLGTGYYRVNFDNVMPDLNYSFFATCATQEDDVATQRFRGTGDILKNVSYVEFKTVYVSATNGNATAQDIESINILIMR